MKGVVQHSSPPTRRESAHQRRGIFLTAGAIATPSGEYTEDAICALKRGFGCRKGPEKASVDNYPGRQDRHPGDRQVHGKGRREDRGRYQRRKQSNREGSRTVNPG